MDPCLVNPITKSTIKLTQLDLFHPPLTTPTVEVNRLWRDVGMGNPHGIERLRLKPLYWTKPVTMFWCELRFPPHFCTNTQRCRRENLREDSTLVRTWPDNFLTPLVYLLSTPVGSDRSGDVWTVLGTSRLTRVDSKQLRSGLVVLVDGFVWRLTTPYYLSVTNKIRRYFLIKQCDIITWLGTMFVFC